MGKERETRTERERENVGACVLERRDCDVSE